MSMTLQFIDQGVIGAGPSESSRSIIRSHVMRGKNAGRPRPSKPKGKRTNTIARVERNLTTPLLLEAEAGYSTPKRQLLWNDLCLTSFPQQLSPQSTKLMHRWFFDISDTLFPPQFCSKFDIIKSIWVNYILADEAYFHCTLAISASFVDVFERKPRISPETLYHISQAYGLVNIKLAGPESVSDSAIAAVISLAIYQQIHHLHSTGLIHLNGLYRMIQLRGGISQLMRENGALALKPLRLDVELALQTGTEPLFCSDVLVPANDASKDSCLMKQQGLNATSKLSCIMLSIVNFANLLNGGKSEGRPKLDPLSFTETIVLLLYRLMEVAPLGSQGFLLGRIQDNLAHLAMLAFLTTLLPEYGHEDSRYILLSERLESAIKNAHNTFSDNEDTELSLLLWTLLIGGISVLKRKDYRWLILETCERLKLYDWPAVLRQLKEFPWLLALHDTPGRCLWEDAKIKSFKFS